MAQLYLGVWGYVPGSSKGVGLRFSRLQASVKTASGLGDWRELLVLLGASSLKRVKMPPEFTARATTEARNPKPWEYIATLLLDSCEWRLKS